MVKWKRRLYLALFKNRWTYFASWLCHFPAVWPWRISPVEVLISKMGIVITVLTPWSCMGVKLNNASITLSIVLGTLKAFSKCLLWLLLKQQEGKFINSAHICFLFEKLESQFSFIDTYLFTSGITVSCTKYYLVNEASSEFMVFVILFTISQSWCHQDLSQTS